MPTPIEYVDWQEDTFVVDSCSECGRPYSEKIGVSPTMPIHDELAEPEWNCVCGGMNEMKYHSDDCPCTLGGENVCELAYYFEDDSILEEESPYIKKEIAS